MSFLKPLIKTFLISGLIFFTLVYLGMKYHWIGFVQGSADKNLELTFPEKPKTLATGNSATNLINEGDDDEDFQPKIIQTLESGSLVTTMTKAQIKQGCSQLLRQRVVDKDVLELAVGDCVLSNYRDPFRETHLEEGTVKSSNSRQAQTKRAGVIKACHQSVSLKKYNNDVEKQLLLGICMSGKGKEG